jgi:hypothetical protein
MKTQQNVLLFDYERGQKITVAQVNTIALRAYEKFNNLIPSNVDNLTSGQFRGEDWGQSMVYPNFCGIMSFNRTLPTCDPSDQDYGLIDTVCRKLIREADDILKYLKEV